MAFTAQKVPPPAPIAVRVDFPPLPPAPQMTNAADNSAMADYNAALSAWYESMKTATLDKLNALATEINNLKSKVK